ncbi:MAG: methylmalonyl-CoA mutase subunit beta [Rhizobiales bacterium]|nr:methylmalonyl-CoA mutase subunit beta [Hyphomicrobiales bacterium]
MSETRSADGFPKVTREDWLKRVDAVLKGAPFAESLISSTASGISIEPLYGEINGPRAWRRDASPWIVSQRIDLPDPAAANAQGLDDLEHGATGLSLIFQGAASGHGFGLTGHDEPAIARALADMRIDCIGLRMEPGPHGRRVAKALSALIAKQPVDPERLDLDFGMDPIGALAARGDLDAPWPETAARLLSTVGKLREQNFAGPFMRADGRIWHEAGATEVQELGLILATLAAYLRALETLPDDALAQSIAVTLAADEDMFVTLAKFRAMRLLWARILDACDLPDTPLKLHGETSWRMMAAKDPHTNMLRATASVFGAGLGGADSIAVLPFSNALGLPNAFSRRVARNAQNILIAESHLWRVADPAAGAGYVESLTQQLCDRAWKEFQAIENAGGIVETLRGGVIQARLAEARKLASEKIAEGRQPILGVTAFANPQEPAPDIEAAIPVTPRPRMAAAVLIEPLPATRRAEAFEAQAAARART